jgi:hypothetical protein
MLSRANRTRALVDELYSRKSGSGGGGGGNQAVINAILANHATGETGAGGVAVPSANAVGIVKIPGFTMTPGGNGKLRLIGTSAPHNSDGAAAHRIALGIKAVPAGSPAPTDWDYPNPPAGVGTNAVTITNADGGDGSASIVWEYGNSGSGGLPNLTPGASYDVYLMAISEASGNISVGQHAAKLDIQELV